MAKEFIQLPSRDSLGTINLNRSVFSTIATNVIDETENVQLFEGSKPFKDQNRRQPAVADCSREDPVQHECH